MAGWSQTLSASRYFARATVCWPFSNSLFPSSNRASASFCASAGTFSAQGRSAAGWSAVGGCFVAAAGSLSAALARAGIPIARANATAARRVANRSTRRLEGRGNRGRMVHRPAPLMSAEQSKNLVDPQGATRAALPPEAGSGFGAGTQLRQYEIIRELGRGGMGIVYLARDTRLGRRVAIKLLLGRSATSTKDFLREARATARCDHDNIVIIHEADEHEGAPYMVLEYLEGKDLRQTLRGRKLAPGRAAELIVPVVRALVRAHALDIVHRDLKPENVFVTAGGNVKVLDF